MNIRYMSKDEFTNEIKKRPHVKIRPILEAFIESEAEIAEIDPTGYWKTPNSARVTIYNAIKRYGYAIDICVNKNKVYLIRKITAED